VGFFEGSALHLFAGQIMKHMEDDGGQTFCETLTQHLRAHNKIILCAAASGDTYSTENEVQEVKDIAQALTQSTAVAKSPIGVLCKTFSTTGVGKKILPPALAALARIKNDVVLRPVSAALEKSLDALVNVEEAALKVPEDLIGQGARWNPERFKPFNDVFDVLKDIRGAQMQMPADLTSKHAPLVARAKETLENADLKLSRSLKTCGVSVISGMVTILKANVREPTEVATFTAMSETIVQSKTALECFASSKSFAVLSVLAGVTAAARNIMTTHIPEHGHSMTSTERDHVVAAANSVRTSITNIKTRKVIYDILGWDSVSKTWPESKIIGDEFFQCCQKELDIMVDRLECEVRSEYPGDEVAQALVSEALRDKEEALGKLAAVIQKIKLSIPTSAFLQTVEADHSNLAAACETLKMQQNERQIKESEEALLACMPGDFSDLAWDELKNMLLVPTVTEQLPLMYNKLLRSSKLLKVSKEFKSQVDKSLEKALICMASCTGIQVAGKQGGPKLHCSQGGV